MSFVHMQCWQKRSNEHEEKFQKLLRMPPDKITPIGNYLVCTENEFLISQGAKSKDGTCVYIGLGQEGKEVAVKCMLTDSCQHLIKNEIQILCLLTMERSPHVVRYLSKYISDGPFTYIVLELCEYSLEEYVKRARSNALIPFDPPRIIKEILMGLETLHKRGYNEQEMVLHRDLKPHNVLVDLEYNIRLADFGVSKNVDQGSTTQNTSGKGDTVWQAAESIPKDDDQSDQVVYKRKSDIQVAGMLAYYVLTKGEHPFGHVDYEREKNIVDGNPVGLNKLNALNPVANDLVSWLLQHKIDDRPFADEALLHPFFLSIKDQFALLHAVANEDKVVRNKPCYVVDELNSLSGYYRGGWKTMLPDEIIQAFSNREYDNNITSLLRFMRNVDEHIADQRIPEVARKEVGDAAQYFLCESRFSILPMFVHRILRSQGGKEEKWVERPKLKPFFFK